MTFDPQFDTPAVLRAYAAEYHYNSNRWSFLTGPSDKIAALARLSGVRYQAAGQLFDHNFRTLVIDAANRLQTTIPVVGDLSDALVAELGKGAAVRPPAPPAADPAGNKTRSDASYGRGNHW